MTRKFWEIVNKVIDEADVLLLVLDSRLIDETLNEDVERKVRGAGKPLIYVVTKADLVSRESLENIGLKPSVYISAKEHWGMTKLRERILIEGKRAHGNKKPFLVGVLGYPNVGKSALINAMKGKKSAGVSSVSGFTRGVQKIKSDNRIMFLDSPGVVPPLEKYSSKHVFIGTIDYDKVKDPDLFAMKLIERYPGIVEKFYDVPVNEDLEETIEAIAVKRNFLMKKGVSDIMRAARQILKDWQTGKIKQE